MGANQNVQKLLSTDLVNTKYIHIYIFFFSFFFLKSQVVC